MGPITTEELAQAAKVVCGEVSGYPYSVACYLRYWLSRTTDPSMDPADIIRGMIADILDDLDLPWSRMENAPTWPDAE